MFRTIQKKIINTKDVANEFISYCSFLDSLNRIWMFYSGLVREPLCLFFVRPKDDREDEVLWGEPAKIDVLGQNEKKVENISKQFIKETRAERWRKKLKIWNTISTYEQFWCPLCNRSIWSRSARSATTATQGRWDSGSKSERKIMFFFLQDYPFQIYDYLQVSRGRSNSRPTRWVSLVEVNSPTNRLPNHRSTQWRS